MPNDTPRAGLYYNEKGERIVTLTHDGETIIISKDGKSIDRFLALMVIRSNGADVSDAEIQKLSPQQALAVLGVLRIGASCDVRLLETRVRAGGKVLASEWDSLSREQQLELTARISGILV